MMLFVNHGVVVVMIYNRFILHIYVKLIMDRSGRNM